MFSTLGTYGLSVAVSTVMGGTLNVLGQTTLSNLSTTGALTIFGTSVNSSNLSTIGQAAFYSSVQIQGGLSVFSSISAYDLTTTSNIYAGGEVTAYSDVRLKDNIVTIDSALDKIMRMRGVYYTRKDSLLIPPQRHVGLIAQEIEEVLPEVVLMDGSVKSVAYGNIVALLIEGFKELVGRLS